MLYSDAYDIDRDQHDDWFDPILHVDTKLFVDPFLIFLDDDPFWGDAHDLLIGHFDRAFKLLAAAGCRKSHLTYKGALALLAFPEPRELCLGYTARGTRGARPERRRTVLEHPSSVCHTGTLEGRCDTAAQESTGASRECPTRTGKPVSL